jgi:hypothetical protein
MSKRRTHPADVRGYSREFEVAAGTGKRYLVDAIPPALWRAVKAQSKRERRSVRHVVLSAFAAFVEAGS